MIDLSAIAGWPVRVFPLGSKFGIEIERPAPGHGFMGGDPVVRWAAPSLEDAAGLIRSMKKRGQL